MKVLLYLNIREMSMAEETYYHIIVRKSLNEHLETNNKFTANSIKNK